MRRKSRIHPRSLSKVVKQGQIIQLSLSMSIVTTSVKHLAFCRWRDRICSIAEDWARTAATSVQSKWLLNGQEC